MTSLLAQLTSYSRLTVDAGDLNSIATFHPSEVSISPALITASVQQTQYQSAIDDSLKQAEHQLGGTAPPQHLIATALQHLIAHFSNLVLSRGNSRVSAPIDLRLIDDQNAIINYAQKLHQLINHHDRLLIQIPATWQGIQAASQLQTQGISCHLNLVLSQHQAIACAHANAVLISVPVGRITDWYKRQAQPDPSTTIVSDIYNYLHKFAHPTALMAGGFRNLQQVIALAGCDYLSISPGIVADLQNTQRPLVRALSPDRARSALLQPQTIDQAQYQHYHQQNPMAQEKLDESLKGFSRSFATLENLLTKRLQAKRTGANLSHATHQIFQLYDLDGDGYVTREEWAGSDAVFDALDRDKDGKITPTEIAIGLGVLI
jgi:transaldolase